MPKPVFFQNGSHGQITLLDTSGSEFCVEPWSQSPDIFHMSQNPIVKLRDQFPGLNVNLSLQASPNLDFLRNLVFLFLRILAEFAQLKTSLNCFFPGGAPLPQTPQ